MTNEQICSLALAYSKGIGHLTAKRLVDELGSAEAVFERRAELPGLIDDLNPKIVELLGDSEAFDRARRELEFAEKNHIDCLTLAGDEAYPSRLRECIDAPLALFFKGKVNFNCRHVVAMVGTRRSSGYGKQFCADFVADMAQLCPDVLIVSGLAYGIDIHSHRAALQNNMATVAVLAHGLDRIYPYVHRKTAVDMLQHGGLLTEYPSGTNPDPYNFVSRNRIVAGISDATIVVESAEKGGSLITAGLAGSYARECFAVPGRVGDLASIGCNQLIRDNKAALFTSAADFVEAMGWQAHKPKKEGVQRSLFLDLTPQEQRVVDLLAELGDLPINTLCVQTNTGIGSLSALLFQMEMKGLVKALPGSVYKLLK